MTAPDQKPSHLCKCRHRIGRDCLIARWNGDYDLIEDDDHHWTVSRSVFPPLKNNNNLCTFYLWPVGAAFIFFPLNLY